MCNSLYKRGACKRICFDLLPPLNICLVFQVPDYAEVIKKPMDLSTVLSRIDLHQYGTVKEFLQDVDLIWQNALEYNPDRDPSGTHSEQHTAWI